MSDNACLNLDMASLGETVRRLREERLLSQEDLAAAAELSRATIQNVEKDKLKGKSGRTIRKLAQAFGITLEQLDKECEEGETDLVELEVPAEMAQDIRNEAFDWGVSVQDFFGMMMYVLDHSPELAERTLQKMRAEGRIPPADELNPPDEIVGIIPQAEPGSTRSPTRTPPAVDRALEGEGSPAAAGRRPRRGSGGGRAPRRDSGPS